MAVKYIFVTGGVVSGLGKGITAASIGRLLKDRGYRVTMQKFDPYINVDPGTMSPYHVSYTHLILLRSNKFLCLGNFRRFLHSFICRIFFPIFQIRLNGPRKKHALLRHKTKFFPQRMLRNLPDIYPVNENFSLRYVIKPVSYTHLFRCIKQIVPAGTFPKTV